MKARQVAFVLAALLATAGLPAGCSAANSSSPSWLAGVKTQDLTSRERQDLERYLNDFPSPCMQVKEPVASCLQQNTACKACVPAAAFVASALRSGRSPEQIASAYRVRFDPAVVHTIDLGDAPSKGPANAPITIVEFADFQCPTCSLAVGVMDRLVEGYAPNVRVVFKNYPLPFHKQADLAARASVAAGKQNKFWEMHHLMFQNHSALQPEDLDRYAKTLGLDLERFHQDLASPEVKQSVERDHAQGDALKLKGTPSVYINGREFDFELFDFGGEDILTWIELDIEMATGRKPTRPVFAPAPASSGHSAPPPEEEPPEGLR